MRADINQALLWGFKSYLAEFVAEESYVMKPLSILKFLGNIADAGLVMVSWIFSDLHTCVSYYSERTWDYANCMDCLNYCPLSLGYKECPSCSN